MIPNFEINKSTSIIYGIISITMFGKNLNISISGLKK